MIGGLLLDAHPHSPAAVLYQVPGGRCHSGTIESVGLLSIFVLVGNHDNATWNADIGAREESTLSTTNCTPSSVSCFIVTIDVVCIIINKYGNEKIMND